jgi:4-hydroxybenzoyl-CoA reductase subunit gamma
MKRIISLNVNGRDFEDVIDDNLLLVDYLRKTRGLTGTKKGCDGGECGACAVLIEGVPRISCITLAASCDKTSIETIEGQAKNGRLSHLQRAFHENLGAQCGFCTPGMIMVAEGLLRKNPDPDDSQIKTALGGNLCRCTGYVKIIKSVRSASTALRSEAMT